MRTDAFDFELPDERIATAPAEPRDSARLMVLHRDEQRIAHHRVSDLPALGVLQEGDLMLVNQTRVLPALLSGTRTSTGGKISGLYLDSEDQGRWRVMLESRGTLKPGELIELGQNLDPPGMIELIEPRGGGEWLAELKGDASDAATTLARVGATPLPPYIRKQRKKLGQDEVNSDDIQRYNTVYAGASGSVAAPTAGLHFTDALLASINQIGAQRAAVDLHVGLGTFAPVRSESMEDHPIHTETYTISRQTLDAIRATRERGNRLLVVGTTTVRALESLPEDAMDPAAHPDGISGHTSLFIHPEADFAFRFTDRLMTNFHLPRSTLLAMVASLPGLGLDRLMHAYREAVNQQYRFYSYGDAMLIV